MQDALVEAVRVWPDDPPRNPTGWRVAVAWRTFLDAARADTSRRRREILVGDQPAPGSAGAVDDTLQLYFLCAHPSLTPAPAVALTLRAVGGPSTRRIAQAYLVPEATTAQRISRAKRTVSGVRFDRPGDVATVLRVLYLVLNEGCSGSIDRGSSRPRRPSPRSTPTPARPGRPTGRRSSSGTTSCSGSPAARWSASTAPSLSARPGARGPAWPP
ncbi:hypothetical protein [Kocuria sabuli]|uniref:hypothetical protein n=1 Tax=Kocuria sabuli TaxID=3071448 RepID=UPI0034D57820